MSMNNGRSFGAWVEHIILNIDSIVLFDLDLAIVLILINTANDRNSRRTVITHDILVDMLSLNLCIIDSCGDISLQQMCAVAHINNAWVKRVRL